MSKRHTKVIVSNMWLYCGNGTHRNEKVRDLSCIFVPGLSILSLASLDISVRTVNDHGSKEDWIEPGEWAVKSSDETPRIGEEEIASVMDLASISIPPISQNRVTSLGWDSLWVLDRLPRKLWECLALDKGSTLLGPEAILLTVGGIPDPVHEEVQNKQEPKEVAVPMVFRWVMIGQVDGAVAVAQGNSCKVPENQHEAPFLIIHIPICSVSRKLNDTGIHVLTKL